MPRSKSNKGFALLEMLIVLFIVAILGSIAILQYRHFFEKGRADEAKQKLWEIRVAWGQYRLNYRDPDITMGDLKLESDVFPTGCTQNARFRYSLNTTHAIATRCKSPAYKVTLNLANSTWGGTDGYY